MSADSVVVICHFASDSLVNIFQKLIEKYNLPWKCITSFVDPKKESTQTHDIQNLFSKNIIPLILCESRNALKQFGVKCPYEFIIEKRDLLHTKNCKDFQTIIQRINCLGTVSLEDIQDWFAGTFRRYLYLDESVHGTSGHIDLNKFRGKNLNDFFNEHLDEKNTIISRFGATPQNQGTDDMLRLRSLLEPLFDNYVFDDKKVQYFDNRIADHFEDWVNSAYDNVESEGFPHKKIPFIKGKRIRYITSTGYLNALYIDDKAESACMDIKNELLPFGFESIENAKKRISELDDLLKSEESDEEKISFKDEKDSLNEIVEKYNKNNNSLIKFDDNFFNVQPLEIKSSDKNLPSIIKNRLQKAIKFGLSFDFVLLDLNLDDSVGRDPSGYHLIKVIKQILPNIPIVIYSNYDDMGHIARAIQCGATWYLKKGNEEKMPRHILQLLKKANWQEEWRSMQDYFPIIFEFNEKDPAFEDKFRMHSDWQYLTAKNLEYYPGKFIKVSKMGGGLTSAITFKAQKGMVLDGKPLQSPVIIKVDAASNTRMEFERYFRMIRPYIANEVGRVENPSIILNRDCSAIVYTFTGHNDNDHKLVSLKALLDQDIQFKASCDYSKFEKVYDDLFNNILPKIHKVSPNREFGGGKNNHSDIFSHSSSLDAKDSPEAAFPNTAFDEVCEKEFWKSYTVRFPASKKYVLKDNAVFEKQPIIIIRDWDNPADCGDLCHFTYHDTILNKGQYDIEAIDDDGNLIILSGHLVDHIVRFRKRIYPGMTLWLKKDSFKKEGERDSIFKDFLDNVKTSAADDNVNFDEESLDKKSTLYLSTLDNVVELCKDLNKAIVGDAYDNKSVLLKSKLNLFNCPVGICHGDLNYSNIMIENQKGKITDTWLIDFARTRRDLISHDFNVLFSSTIALLFKRELFVGDYEEKLDLILERFIKDVMFALNDDPPDYIESDLRFSMIYRILRRIRQAAIKSGISLHSYTLTTALEALLAAKIRLIHESNIKAFEAFVDIAKCYYDWLKNELQLDLVENLNTKKSNTKKSKTKK